MFNSFVCHLVTFVCSSKEGIGCDMCMCVSFEDNKLTNPK